jgi:hypothetical protein
LYYKIFTDLDSDQKRISNNLILKGEKIFYIRKLSPWVYFRRKCGLFLKF